VKVYVDWAAVRNTVCTILNIHFIFLLRNNGRDKVSYASKHRPKLHFELMFLVRQEDKNIPN
jgi:hypothetical protein